MRRCLLAALLPLGLSGCSVWFFSGEAWIDRSRPVALVETTGGVEFAATTEFGVLTLGRTATAGPCRVHYFLGPTPMVEDGELTPTASMFTVAEIDLKTMALRSMDHGPAADDELLVMWTPEGTTTEVVPVALARERDVEGDVLRHPGRDLPVGATLLRRTDDGLQFAGLVAGKVVVADGAASREYFVVAGVDRVRELLAIPARHPRDYVPKYRVDDVSVMKPQK